MNTHRILITTLAIALTAFGTFVTAQEKNGDRSGDGPFIKKKAESAKTAQASGDETDKKAKSETIANVGTIFQFIDVKRERWQDWLDEHAAPRDAGELRDEVEGWIADGDAELAETSFVIGRSGQRMKVESHREMHYPTNFEPGAEQAPYPTEFDQQNTGSTVEVDPVLSKGGAVDLNFAPERIRYRGENPPRPVPAGVEEEDVRWPVFFSQKVTAQTELGENQWALIGSETPLAGGDSHRTLIFTRPAVHRFEAKDGGKRGGTNHQGILKFEWIEVDHGSLNGWLMDAEDMGDWLAGGLREKATSESGEVRATRLVRVRSGQRVKNESIEHIRYPAAFEQSDEGSFSRPTDLATRSTGITVEVDPAFHADGKVAEINLAPEWIRHFGETVHHRVSVDGTWSPDVTSPNFYAMKVTTQVSAPVDTPVLVAVMSPPDEEGRIDSSRKMLLFLTVSH